MSGLYTPGLPPVAAGAVISELPANALIAADVVLSGGQNPQTVAATCFQIAMHAANLIANSATSTAGAATLNTTGGLITTESLSTAVGATYSFVLTNSLITATSPVPQVAMYNKTNTGGAISVTSITNASGSCTIVFTNTGTTALNGTTVIAFHV